MKARRKGTKREQLLAFRLNKARRDWRVAMDAWVDCLVSGYGGSAERFDQAMTGFVRDLQQVVAQHMVDQIFKKGEFLGFAK